MKNNTKKIISLILAAAILSGCTSGVAEDTTETEETAAETAETSETVPETAEETETETETVKAPVETEAPAVSVMENVLSAEDYPADLEGYARTMLEKIRSEMTNEKTGFAYEFLGKKQIAFLWPFSVLLESVSSLYECDTTDEELRDYYVLLLDKFLPRYEGSMSGIKRVYASTMDNGDKYYDDNEWIVIELSRAYRLLGDEKYLDYAKELAEFCYSGWSNSSGGIKWKVDSDSCNTCSNGPAAVLSCMLYEDTGDEYYLDWAKKIYAWTYENLRDTDGTYFDNKKINGGSVDKAKYAYNTGTMIVSGVQLYRITGEKDYLTQARQSAKGGEKEFFLKSSSRCVVRNSHPWFNSWLLEGYIELFETDTEDGWTKDYIDDFYKVLDNAVNRAGDGIYVGKSWNSKADSEVELIHQAGTVRALAQISRVLKEYAK